MGTYDELQGHARAVLDQLDADLLQARADLTAAQVDADEWRTTADNLGRELTQRDTDIARQSAEIANLAARVETLTAERDELQRRLDELTPPAEQATEGLPWILDYEAMNASSRKVLAHLFMPYPLSWNNETPSNTQYLNYYNNPAYSAYTATGGMFRDRPLERPRLDGDWLYKDCQTWIDTAHAAGINGFLPDLLGLTGSNHDRYMVMVQAAHDRNDGTLVVPMIDMNGATRKATAGAAADVVRRYLLTGGKGSTPRNSAWRLPDGRYVVSAYKAEGPDGAGAAAQKQWINDLTANLRDTWGVEIAWLACYLDYSKAANFAGMQWGSGSWGYGADPAAIRAASNQTGAARARGEIAMAPVCAQDVRYGNGGPIHDEALNTGAQRAAWEKVLAEQPEIVQLVTWNDFSETPIAPSVQNGHCILDLGTWYLHQYKTGREPEIVRDGLYLSHRSQTLNATITGQQSKPDARFPRGALSTPRDHVEVVSFLTAPARITVNTGARIETYDAPAGMHVWSAPAGVCPPGTIQAAAERGGQTVAQVTSPVGHRDNDIASDRGYYRFSSTRGTAGQEDTLARYR